MTPQNNDELKAEEYEIEIEECGKESNVWKYVFVGVLAAFCFGMAIAFFIWSAQLTYDLRYLPDSDYFYAMVNAIVTLTVIPTICGTVVIFKAISANANSKRRLEKKIIECAAKKCAQDMPETKKEKGFNFKISKF